MAARFPRLERALRERPGAGRRPRPRNSWESTGDEHGQGQGQEGWTGFQDAKPGARASRGFEGSAHGGGVAQDIAYEIRELQTAMREARSAQRARAEGLGRHHEEAIHALELSEDALFGRGSNAASGAELQQSQTSLDGLRMAALLQPGPPSEMPNHDYVAGGGFVGSLGDSLAAEIRAARCEAQEQAAPHGFHGHGSDSVALGLHVGPTAVDDGQATLTAIPSQLSTALGSLFEGRFRECEEQLIRARALLARTEASDLSASDSERSTAEKRGAASGKPDGVVASAQDVGQMGHAGRQDQQTVEDRNAAATGDGRTTVADVGATAAAAVERDRVLNAVLGKDPSELEKAANQNRGPSPLLPVQVGGQVAAQPLDPAYAPHSKQSVTSESAAVSRNNTTPDNRVASPTRLDAILTALETDLDRMFPEAEQEQETGSSGDGAAHTTARIDRTPGGAQQPRSTADVAGSVVVPYHPPTLDHVSSCIVRDLEIAIDTLLPDETTDAPGTGDNGDDGEEEGGGEEEEQQEDESSIVSPPSALKALDQQQPREAADGAEWTADPLQGLREMAPSALERMWGFGQQQQQQQQQHAQSGSSSPAPPAPPPPAHVNSQLGNQERFDPPQPVAADMPEGYADWTRPGLQEVVAGHGGGGGYGTGIGAGAVGQSGCQVDPAFVNLWQPYDHKRHRAAVGGLAPPLRPVVWVGRDPTDTSSIILPSADDSVGGFSADVPGPVDHTPHLLQRPPPSLSPASSSSSAPSPSSAPLPTRRSTPIGTSSRPPPSPASLRLPADHIVVGRPTEGLAQSAQRHNRERQRNRIARNPSTSSLPVAASAAAAMPSPSSLSSLHTAPHPRSFPHALSYPPSPGHLTDPLLWPGPDKPSARPRTATATATAAPRRDNNKASVAATPASPPATSDVLSHAQQRRRELQQFLSNA